MSIIITILVSFVLTLLLGRIVIPVEIRRSFDISIKDELEIFVDGDNIILKKHSPCCIFCGSQEGVTQFKGKNICKNCKSELK